MEYRIIDLPKDKWKGTVLPIKYTTDQYYDVVINRTNKGFAMIFKKGSRTPITRGPNTFSDRLYEIIGRMPCWGGTDGELIPPLKLIQIMVHRLRITICGWGKYQKQE